MAQLMDQLLIVQPLMGRDLGCGGTGDPVGQGLGLDQQIIYPCLFQKPGAEDPGHAAADDQNIGMGIPFQGAKRGQLYTFPNGFHEITSRLVFHRGKKLCFSLDS